MTNITKQRKEPSTKNLKLTTNNNHSLILPTVIISCLHRIIDHMPARIIFNIAQLIDRESIMFMIANPLLNYLYNFVV